MDDAELESQARAAAQMFMKAMRAFVEGIVSEATGNAPNAAGAGFTELDLPGRDERSRSVEVPVIDPRPATIDPAEVDRALGKTPAAKSDPPLKLPAADPLDRLLHPPMDIIAPPSQPELPPGVIANEAASQFSFSTLELPSPPHPQSPAAPPLDSQIDVMHNDSQSAVADGVHTFDMRRGLRTDDSDGRINYMQQMMAEPNRYDQTTDNLLEASVGQNRTDRSSRDSEFRLKRRIAKDANNDYRRIEELDRSHELSRENITDCNI